MFLDLVDSVSAKAGFLEVFPFEAGSQDIGKLVISGKKAGLDGKMIADILRDRYHLETEMSTRDYCLAMFTVGDTDEAFNRMEKAIFEIDAEAKIKANAITLSDENFLAKSLNCGFDVCFDSYLKRRNACVPIYEAFEAECEEIDPDNAIGRISADFIGLYPPGTPILVPGEVFESEDIRQLSEYEHRGYQVTGLNDGRIKVLRETIT